MSIVVNLDVMLAKRKMSSLELAEKIGITPANLSILKTGKAKAVRFSTLEAICKELDCQPGDILEFVEEQKMKKKKQDRDIVQMVFQMKYVCIINSMFIIPQRLQIRVKAWTITVLL